MPPWCQKILPLVSLLWGLLWGSSAAGYYLIPYQLRLRSADRPGMIEIYPVRVVLADYYSRFFGAGDDLQTYLLQTHHPESSDFVSRYLKGNHRWYLGEIHKHPAIYGSDPDFITRGLASYEPAADGRSSFVIFGRPRLVEEGKEDEASPWDEAALESETPVALFRVSMPGADGLLPSERHFLGKGLASPFPKMSDPKFDWVQVATLRHLYRRGHFPLVFPPEQERLFWLTGGKIELKNYCLDPEFVAKIYPYFVAIGDRHKLLDYSGEPFPTEITTYPNGSPIPQADRQRLGMLATTVWADNYGPILLREYTRLGMERYEKINNEHTGNLDLYFTRGQVATVKARSYSRVTERFGGIRGKHDWLVYDRKLALRLLPSTRQTPRCSSVIAE